MKQVTFLIFAYEPIEKIRVPVLLDSVEEAMEFVKPYQLKRNLHYIDIHMIVEPNELFTRSFDSEINMGELKSIFTDFKNLANLLQGE